MDVDERLLNLIVFVPFAAAALALLIGRKAGQKTGWLMVLAAGQSVGLVIYLMMHAAASGGGGEPVWFQYDWLPSLNIAMRLSADHFGLFFAMLVSGIGVLVGIYSLHYIPDLDNARIGRYYAALIAFMGAMLGIALADDLFLLFVFWEITSITSFMLIGFWYEQDIARKGAMTALQVTAMGGLAMMVGFVMVGWTTETFQISLLASDPAIRNKLVTSPLFIPAMLLIFGGAFTKSAQFPFHFWLPNAMVAPTPVSTYLHAATMVKAGIFLLGRMMPIFGGSDLWSPILVTVGLITFVYTAYQSLQETDLKAVLARTTLSTLGLVTFIYGIKASSQDALQIFNHAAYKGALFLIVGIIEHATHTRDINELGGLRKKMPITCLLCIFAALSMSGLPPFFGFLAKESLYAELLHNNVLSHWGLTKWFIIALCVIANAFIFAVSWKIILSVFFGEETEKAHHAHEAGFGLLLSPGVLAGTALVIGLLGFTHVPENLVNFLSSDPHAHLHVALIPDPNHLGPLYLSLCTITLGFVIYQGRRIIEPIQFGIRDALPTMQSHWDRMMHCVAEAATVYANRWQNGSLHWYFSGILTFFVVICGYTLYRGGLDVRTVDINLGDMPWFAGVLSVLLCLSIWQVVTSRTRLGASIALTATGFLVSLLFVVYRSPDILLTQLLIETVSTIFILLILYFMPAFKPDVMSAARKLVNITLSLAVGSIMFAYVMFATSKQFKVNNNLSGEYLSRALEGPNGTEGAGGKNAVNVIIVDFRAIDTTGEIAVLVVVGLCIYGVLRSRRDDAAEIKNESEAKA